ncbi:ankyrin repeat domain-containing protein [Endozoicomonas sp. ONNA2]|uniref:ankyrin repeat domain-containing protein n=1 Tax=Endozoicomonas sp. ONNA2 TaxID=2828741 RepID=UPI002147DDF3|nr:ankyrin repeat domain-containing protein [Endozoicomonas sp. ONNA2]
MNISAAPRTLYGQLANNKDVTACDASKQSATGSSSVSLAPCTHRTHSSGIGPSLTCQTPVGDRAIETKTEPPCQKMSVTIDDERTGHIKKADRKKATKEFHSLLKDTENLEDLTNDKILDLIKEGADVNTKIKNSGKKTALHLVAARGNKRIIELLVAAKADVNARTSADYTVMQYAHKSGSVTPLIRLMVNAGFKIDAPCDDYGATMLIHAAREHNWALLEFLLDNGADINDRIDDNGTVLHLAARLGQPDKMEMLIKHVEDVNVRDNNGQTVLHLVAESGQREILDQLLELNADVNAQDNNGRTPLYLLTCANGQLDTIEYFMKTLIGKQADINHRDKDGRTPLAFLVKHLRDQNATKYVIDTLTDCKAADINALDSHGFTPLHFAAENGELDVFKHLINKGANKWARSNTGKTVLEIAESRGFNTAKMLETLYGAEYDVDVINASCDSEGGTAIAYAARNRQWKLLDTLISRGARIDAWQNESGQSTPLHCAAAKGEKDIVRELVKRNADVRLPNAQGNLAIHHALLDDDFPWRSKKSMGDRLDILAELIEKGNADINARGYQGATALHIAARGGMVEIVAELLKRGADFNILDDDNKTAYDLTFDSLFFYCKPPEVKMKIRELIKEYSADVSGKSGQGGISGFVQKLKKVID